MIAHLRRALSPVLLVTLGSVSAAQKVSTFEVVLEEG